MYIPPNWLVSIQNDPMAKKASLWGFQIFGVVLMIFAPVDVLSRYPLLAVLVDFISGLVPSINKWAVHSPWPQVTRLFFTYCWLTLPVQVVIISKYLFSLDLKPKFGLLKRWLGACYFLLFAGCCLLMNYYYAIPHTTSMSYDDPYRTKLFQSFYGVLMVFVDAFFIAMAALMLKRYKLIFLK
jgi:hypothetical protein